MSTLSSRFSESMKPNAGTIVSVWAQWCAPQVWHLSFFGTLDWLCCESWLENSTKTKAKQRQLFRVGLVRLWSQTQAQQLVSELNYEHLRCDIFHFWNVRLTLLSKLIRELNQNKSKQRQLFRVGLVGLWSQTQAQQLVSELNYEHLRCDIFYFLER